MTNPIKTVIAGYGKATRFYHVPFTASTPGLALHGIAPAAQRSKRKSRLHTDAKLTSDWIQCWPIQKLIWLWLSTPNSTHASMAVASLDAGKHVVTEKVMCLNLAECDAMLEAANRSGKLLSVFQNRRWDGDFLTVRRLLEEGKLGAVRWIEMAWQRWDPPTGWRAEAGMGGGRFYDLGAHLLDQLLLLFPQDVESVYCKMHHDFPDLDVESHAMIVVNFVDGATGVIDLGSMAAIGKPRFHLFGEKGSFIKHGLDPQDDAARSSDIDAATLEDEANFGQLFDGATRTTIPTIKGAGAATTRMWLMCF